MWIKKIRFTHNLLIFMFVNSHTLTTLYIFSCAFPSHTYERIITSFLYNTRFICIVNVALCSHLCTAIRFSAIFLFTSCDHLEIFLVMKKMAILISAIIPVMTGKIEWKLSDAGSGLSGGLHKSIKERDYAGTYCLNINIHYIYTNIIYRCASISFVYCNYNHMNTKCCGTLYLVYTVRSMCGRTQRIVFLLKISSILLLLFIITL